MTTKSQSAIVKQKICKNTACKAKFTPSKPLQSVCGWECAKDKAEHDRLKKEAKEATTKRIEHRKEKEQAKTRAQWMKESQQVFNAYIRARDADQPCISCGCGNIRYVSGNAKVTSWDAGHYKTTGAHPELRFNELNVHKQCVHDNQHLHGDIIRFRAGLIERIGIDKVEWLEGPHQPKKYTIFELKEIKSQYKEKLKGLQNDGI